MQEADMLRITTELIKIVLMQSFDYKDTLELLK